MRTPKSVLNVVEAVKYIGQKTTKRFLKGIGSHDSGSCPLANAFGSDNFWHLTKYTRGRLSNIGIGSTSFKRFITWYDTNEAASYKRLKKLVA